MRRDKPRTFSDREVRAILNDNRTYRTIAAEYGCSHPHIGRIKNGEVYQDVYYMWLEEQTSPVALNQAREDLMEQIKSLRDQIIANVGEPAKPPKVFLANMDGRELMLRLMNHAPTLEISKWLSGMMIQYMEGAVD